MKTGTLRFKDDNEFFHWMTQTAGVDLSKVKGLAGPAAPTPMPPIMAWSIIGLVAVVVVPFALFALFWAWVLLMALIHS